MFLFLGGLLYLFAKTKNINVPADDLFPTVALHFMPTAMGIIFIIGLISALFPSADGALTALTSSFCIDMLGLKRREDWDEKKKTIMRYEVNADGTLTNGLVFFDMTGAPGEDAIDGLKVDRDGNVYVSGPGGLWILSPGGTRLGTIVGPEHPHDFAPGSGTAAL